MFGILGRRGGIGNNKSKDTDYIFHTVPLLDQAIHAHKGGDIHNRPCTPMAIMEVRNSSFIP